MCIYIYIYIYTYVVSASDPARLAGLLSVSESESVES